MRRFFSSDPSGEPFTLFGFWHLSSVASTLAGAAASVLLGRRLGPVGRRRMRWGIAGALWAQEVSHHAWKLKAGRWSVQEMLPLHLCSVLVWADGLVLLRPTRLGDTLSWFWGLSGATQALATPDIGEFGFPHYRHWQFFISHGLLLTVPLWQVFVEGRRPTARDGAVALGLVLVQAGLAFLVNRRLGSNYMFISRKPDTASLLDRLPAWPGYVPVLVLLAGGVFAIAYLPLAVLRAREQG